MMSASTSTGLFDFLELINAWATDLISSMGYPGLALVMFLENVFPPIPSEIILPLAGSLSITGQFSLLGITLVGMAGSVAGAWVFYGLGYWLDEVRVRLLVQKYGKWLLLSEKDFDRALIWFQAHGDKVIFFGRMIPLVRSLISIPAGLARMSPLRFTLFTALGTAFWNFGLALTGRLLGENWTMIDQILSKYDLIVTIFIAALFIAFILKRRKDRNENKQPKVLKYVRYHPGNSGSKNDGAVNKTGKVQTLSSISSPEREPLHGREK